MKWIGTDWDIIRREWSFASDIRGGIEGGGQHGLVPEITTDYSLQIFTAEAQRTAQREQQLN